MSQSSPFLNFLSAEVETLALVNSYEVPNLSSSGLNYMLEERPRLIKDLLSLISSL
jgi:hypothetical protein